MIPREVIDQIRDRVDLVALVSRRSKLTPGASSHYGPCPFCESASGFHVVPSKAIYHCFGCGESGDAFRWLMVVEGRTFREAVEELAASVCIEVVEVESEPAPTVVPLRLPSAVSGAGEHSWRPTRTLVHLLWLLIHRRDEVVEYIAGADLSMLLETEDDRVVVRRLLADDGVATMIEDSPPRLARVLGAIVARDDLYSSADALPAARALVARGPA